MSSFIFSHYAKKKFGKLDLLIQQRVLKKLQSLQAAYDERSMRALHNALPATHRLRIGDFRLILTHQSEDKYIVIDIGHRSEIYK